MNRISMAFAAGAAAALAMTAATPLRGATPACDPDNGGITLPAGFCALVVADDLGRARLLAVAANGDVYVATLGGGAGKGNPPLVALRDADGDGKFEIQERFGDSGATGIAIRNGALYVATPTA